MYKAGKSWVVASLVFFGLVAGLELTTNFAAVDTVNQNDPTTVAAKTISDTSQQEKSTVAATAQATTANNTTSSASAAESQPANANTQDATSVDKSQTTTTSTANEAAATTTTTQTATQATTQQNTSTRLTVSKDFVNSENQLDTEKIIEETKLGWQDINGKWYYFEPETGVAVKGQKKLGGSWFHFDENTGAMSTGFTYLKDDHKLVYYSEDKNTIGRMQFGWQAIKGKQYYLDRGTGAVTKGQKKLGGSWFHFDENTGAMSTGFTYLNDAHKLVYYSEDKNTIGRMQFGWQAIKGKQYYLDRGTGAVTKGQKKLGGSWFHFDENTGAMSTGITYLNDAHKLVYYSEDKNTIGRMQFGEHKINGYWYYLDRGTGEVKTGFQNLPDGRTVYYNQAGQMQFGWQSIGDESYYFDLSSGMMFRGLQEINGKVYYFDPVSGAVKINEIIYNTKTGTLSYIGSEGILTNGERIIGNVEYIFNDSGALVHPAGEAEIDNHWYLFGSDNQVLIGFQNLADGRTVYYSPDTAQMQLGWQEINGKWYYFMPETGAVVKGQKELGGSWFHFDETTGAMSTGFTYLNDAHKLVYYSEDKNTIGRMQFGWQVLNDKHYYFDRGTGAVTRGQKKLGGSWFHFDETTGAMSIGFKYLNDGHKLVYYSEDKNTIGRMQYGQQKINGHWYLFDKVSGAMKTGFQYIAEQKKIVYYAGNGQMVYGWQNMYGNRYFFDRESGAQAKSEILRIDGHYYAFDGRGNAHDFNELNSLINRLGSNISVAIQSQRSGQIYTYSNAGNRRYSTASTVKAAVLAELLHNRGGNLTAEERHLAEIMIRNSDNGATTNLIRYHLGEAGSPVNRLYRDLGMRNTTPSSSWGATQTTPADQLKLLYQIFMTDHSSYLNRKSQDYIRHLMHTVSAGQRWGISAGSSDYYLKNGWVPFGWNGNDPWFVNSIGFIPNNGHGYTIAIYSANNPFSQGINKIEQVARKVSQMLK
ncbi:serine hydrolase [Ligilactobacillus saerimneri]|uniref:serine hydrolase n=1 Tax=Ligilactobacillus saerimneri TaxID=228229 RepID=UPI001C1052C7|nr:serine hydrolase [Ligilactobacillus saerimneri]